VAQAETVVPAVLVEIAAMTGEIAAKGVPAAQAGGRLKVSPPTSSSKN
jgi:hypothetical protein